MINLTGIGQTCHINNAIVSLSPYLSTALPQIHNYVCLHLYTLLGRLERIKCGLLPLMTPASVSLSRVRDVQKRLNGLTSYLGWRLLGGPHPPQRGEGV